MATTNKAPSATYSFSSGTITYPGGSGNYTNLTDASDSSYSQFAGGSAYASWPLVDMPTDLITVTAVTINIREARSSSKGDFASLSSVQIFKSDGSTAITSSVTTTDSTSITTFNLTPSTINYTDKTSWDGAVIKVLQDIGTGGGIRIYELNVDITYTVAPAAAAFGVTILRPANNVNNGWANNWYYDVDDVMTQPSTSGGDSTYCGTSGSGGYTQQWGVTPPYIGYTIIKAKVWFLARYQTNGVTIIGVKVRLNGTWNDYGNPSVSLTTSFVWYGYEITGLKENANGCDPAIEIILQGSGGTSVSQVEAAYLELTYAPTVTPNIIKSFALQRASKY